MKNHENLIDKTFNYTKNDFGDDFLWGVSTLPYQFKENQNISTDYLINFDESSTSKEASINIDPSKINVAFYKNFKENLKIIKKSGLTNIKLSISWAKILPYGIGEVNQDGINFYNEILDTCIENSIEPFITLYHWDLPLELEKKGGWANRDVLNWFEEYTKVCVNAFKNKVKYWIVLNDPSGFVGAGYFLGANSNGKKKLNIFLPAMHHALLCQSIGYKTIKQIDSSSQVGTSISCTHITPKTYSEKNIIAAERINTLLNKAFIEPSFGLGYPVSKLPFLKYISKYTHKGDEELIKVDFDFIELQNYTRKVVEHHSYTPYVNAKLVTPKKNTDTDSINWEIHPKSFYMMILKFSEYIGVKKIIVAENGVSFLDEIKKDIIDEEKQIFYTQNYLKQVLYAQQKSDKIKGYFVWSLTDTYDYNIDISQKFGTSKVNKTKHQSLIKNFSKWIKTFLDGKLNN